MSCSAAVTRVRHLHLQPAVFNGESSELEAELSPYAFRVFKFGFRPKAKGKVIVMAKAINRLEQEQPFAHEIQWNHSGYKYNGIDSLTIEVL